MKIFNFSLIFVSFRLFRYLSCRLPLGKRRRRRKAERSFPDLRRKQTTEHTERAEVAEKRSLFPLFPLLPCIACSGYLPTTLLLQILRRILIQSNPTPACIRCGGGCNLTLAALIETRAPRSFSYDFENAAALLW